MQAVPFQPYQNGYTAPTRPFYGDSVSINIGWGRDGGQQADLHEPQIFSIEGDYDEYAGTNASRASGFHSAASILMALLLLHHTLLMTAAGANEDVSTFYVLFLLRTVGFLLPCYIMACAMNSLQCRHQQQVTAMAAEEAAYISAHRRSSRNRGRTPSA